jgi:regulator of Ty1 transposition protein 109
VVGVRKVAVIDGALPNTARTDRAFPSTPVLARPRPSTLSHAPWATMAGIAMPNSLRDVLAEQLPLDVPFTFYHYSTPPTKSSAIFAAPPSARSERTYCESHFLAASIIPQDAAISQAPEELLILAIEVLIYTTRNLTTIFVSKADSTGCLSELHLPRSQSGSPLKTICGTFVSWLARERQREGKKLVISLFARAQDQYLFPASIDNKSKHVLDDRGLVKWWCQVLDPIIWQYKAEEERKPFTERLTEDRFNGSTSQSEATAKGYLIIPGYETYDTLRYTPPSRIPNAPRRWAATHPLLHIAPHPAAPPRCLVPHFPDDPKARFLDELDEELPDRGTDATTGDGGTPSRSNGIWKSVKTLEQFWDFMAFRQECSSGRIVGFIWVVITPPQPAIPEEEEPSQQSVSQVDSQQTAPSPHRRKTTKRRKKFNTDYGPIPPRLPRIKTTSSNLSTSSNSSNIPETSPYFVWPATSRGTVCFSTKDYDRAHEVLIHLPFATRVSAAAATKRWKDEIAVLGGVDEWGWSVIGTKEYTSATPSQTNEAAPTMVMGVRKKRKPDAPTVAESVDNVHDLGTDTVRKKPKLEYTPVPAAGFTNGVNTLSAGMVRKKSRE